MKRLGTPVTALLVVLAACSGTQGPPVTGGVDVLTVTKVSPTFGTTAGGTELGITGTNFVDGVTVTVGAVPCTSVTVLSGTSLNCTTGAFTPATIDSTVDLAVTATDGTAKLTSGFAYLAPRISVWTFVDGNSATTGINKNPVRPAGTTGMSLANFNGNLYGAWSETDGSASQIRVAQFNGPTAGTIASDLWTFVDGDGSTGINKATGRNATSPSLFVLGANLYITWSEANGSAVTQTRVAVYTGARAGGRLPPWDFIDGDGADGLNKDPAKNAVFPALGSVGGKLYAAWTEETSSNQDQVRVAVYNGVGASPLWSFVDGDNATTGLNRTATNFAQRVRFATLGTKLYAGWKEGPFAGPHVIHVAVFDGVSAWTFVTPSAGLNKNVLLSADQPDFSVFQSRLYGTWTEPNGVTTQVRAMVFNGNDSSPTWTFVDGNSSSGLNLDTSHGAASARFGQFNGKLFLTWTEYNGNVNVVRSRVYGGADNLPLWTSIDGSALNGQNKSGSLAAVTPQYAIYDSKLHLLWGEDGGAGVYQVRAASGH